MIWSHLDAGRIPRLAEVSIDGGVFAFVVMVAAATSLIIGVAPIVQVLRGSNRRSLGHGSRTTGGRGQRRLREVLGCVDRAGGVTPRRIARPSRAFWCR